MEKLPEVGKYYNYTKKDSLYLYGEKAKWFRCQVIGHWDGLAIIRTNNGYIHLRGVGDYVFAEVQP